MANICKFINRNGGFMKKLDIAKLIIKNNGGIAKTMQLNKAGIQNSEIMKMGESGEFERVKHEYY